MRQSDAPLNTPRARPTLTGAPTGSSSKASWHHLLDLCALTGTLICDGDRIYSPGAFNDRLLLGLKGTMSEAELHLIRSRLRGGIENKARRGEDDAATRCSFRATARCSSCPVAGSADI